MPKHLTRIEVVLSLPDISTVENGYPVYLDTDGVLYIADTDAATPHWRAARGASATVVAATGAYTVTDTDERPVVLADATAATFAVTLPAASSGLEVVVKKTDASANAVTIETPGAETIDGAANATLAAQYDSLHVVSDGTNWFEV